MAARVTQISVKGFDENFAYLVHDLATKQGYIVDPSGSVERIEYACRVLGIEVIGVLVTHTHFDHIDGLPAVLAEHPVPVFVHEAGATAITAGSVRPLCDGDILALGEDSLRVIHTPGHAPDAVCFLLTPEGVAPQLITGDTLFVDGCGRIAAADTQTMFDSLQRLKALPSATVIYPGHDYGPTPTSTLAQECEQNPYLTATDVESFAARRFAT